MSSRFTCRYEYMKFKSSSVADDIQYNDSTPFQSLQLYCAVIDVEKEKSMHGKLTALVRYHLRYKLKGQPLTISFGLGADVVVNSIIGLPTLRIWGGLLDFINNKFTAPAIHTQIPLLYEKNKQGLPPSIEFPEGKFIRPICGHNNVVIVLLTNINTTLAPTVDPPNPVNTVTSPIVVDSNTTSCFRREVKIAKT